MRGTAGCKNQTAPACTTAQQPQAPRRHTPCAPQGGRGLQRLAGCARARAAGAGRARGRGCRRGARARTGRGTAPCGARRSSSSPASARRQPPAAGSMQRTLCGTAWPLRPAPASPTWPPQLHTWAAAGARTRARHPRAPGRRGGGRSRGGRGGRTRAARRTCTPGNVAAGQAEGRARLQARQPLRRRSCQAARLPGQAPQPRRAAHLSWRQSYGGSSRSRQPWPPPYSP